MRNALPASAADAKIQTIDNPALGRNVVQIATPTLQPPQVDEVNVQLDRSFGLTQEPEIESIGPTFGQSVANSALIAIIASLTVISVYLALRFEWKFAVPVLIATMHDILIVSGVYALTGREVTTSTVAALLTILGYSLYDTIIVFDRIRENVPRMPSAAFSQIMNRSLSEVIVRSLVTSFSTLLPVLALMLFGGDTLKDFAFALLVGIASGTYSSVFIATPVLSHWKEREPTYRARERRIREQFGGSSRPMRWHRPASRSTSRRPPSGRRGRQARRRGRSVAGRVAGGVRRHGAQPRASRRPRRRRDRGRRTPRRPAAGAPARARTAAPTVRSRPRRRGRRERGEEPPPKPQKPQQAAQQRHGRQR